MSIQRNRHDTECRFMSPTGSMMSCRKGWIKRWTIIRKLKPAMNFIERIKTGKADSDARGRSQHCLVNTPPLFSSYLTSTSIRAGTSLPWTPVILAKIKLRTESSSSIEAELNKEWTWCVTITTLDVTMSPNELFQLVWAIGMPFLFLFFTNA